MAKVYVGIGSNLLPEKHIRIAVAELEQRFGPLTLSPVYRNPAVGFDGPDFYNLVAGFDTECSPADLMGQIEEIHELADRARGPDKFVTRSLDIDLLIYGDVISEQFKLPRADVLDYEFALKPLCDIAPRLRHVQTGRQLRSHWREMSENGHALELVDFDLHAPAGA